MNRASMNIARNILAWNMKSFGSSDDVENALDPDDGINMTGPLFQENGF